MQQSKPYVNRSQHAVANRNGIKVILKILFKTIANEKYRDINYGRLVNRISEYNIGDCFIDLLYLCGFQKNNAHLQLGTEHIQKAKFVHDQLSQFLNKPSIDSFITIQEATKRIKHILSHNDSVRNTFNELVLAGITEEEAIESIYTVIKGICVIDTATTSGLLFGDYSVIRRALMEKMKNPISMYPLVGADIGLFGAKAMEPELQVMVRQLISHELHKYYPAKYEDELSNSLPQYIDKLFHHICSKKKVIRLNWERMNIELATDLLTFGYQGYLFLKPLLFLPGAQMVNLDVVCGLFPNLRLIVLQALSSVSRQCLDHILDFVRRRNRSGICTLEYIILIFSNAIDNPNKEYAEVKKLESLFFNNGWRITMKFVQQDYTHKVSIIW
eukprot:233317_1